MISVRLCKVASMLMTLHACSGNKDYIGEGLERKINQQVDQKQKEEKNPKRLDKTKKTSKPKKGYNQSVQ